MAESHERRPLAQDPCPPALLGPSSHWLALGPVNVYPYSKLPQPCPRSSPIQSRTAAEYFLHLRNSAKRTPNTHKDAPVERDFNPKYHSSFRL